jgi:hypothetical protein
LSNQDIDNILAYTDYTPPPPAVTVAASAQTVSQGSDISVNVILAVAIVIFTILIVMLFLVQRTLIKIANASVKMEMENRISAQISIYMRVNKRMNILICALILFSISIFTLAFAILINVLCTRNNITIKIVKMTIATANITFTDISEP